MSSKTVCTEQVGWLYNALKLLTLQKHREENISLEAQYQELLCVSEQLMCFCLLDTENHWSDLSLAGTNCKLSWQATAGRKTGTAVLSIPLTSGFIAISCCIGFPLILCVVL